MNDTNAIALDTRTKILDVTEQMFAESGPTAISIRAIAKAAQVNLASVNYHFGTKDQLLEEVLKRRIVPLNKQRILLLDDCAACGPNETPSLEKAIEAMVKPSVHLWSVTPVGARGLLAMQFLARAFASLPVAGGMLESEYGPVRSRFIGIIRRIRPDLTDTEILWRYNFLVGAMLYSMVGPVSFQVGSGDLRSVDPDEVLRQIVAYAVGGFCAPSVANCVNYGL